MTYRIVVTKYGYANVEADSADEALSMVCDMDDKDFDWSEFDEAEIMEEWED